MRRYKTEHELTDKDRRMLERTNGPAKIERPAYVARRQRILDAGEDKAESPAVYARLLAEEADHLDMKAAIAGEKAERTQGVEHHLDRVRRKNAGEDVDDDTPEDVAWYRDQAADLRDRAAELGNHLDSDADADGGHGVEADLDRISKVRRAA